MIFTILLVDSLLSLFLYRFSLYSSKEYTPLSSPTCISVRYHRIIREEKAGGIILSLLLL